MLPYNKLLNHINIPLETYQKKSLWSVLYMKWKGKKKQKPLKIWPILQLSSQQKSAREEMSFYMVPVLCEKIDKLLIASVVVFVI